MEYDKTREILYIFGEIYGTKISNKEMSRRIIKNGWNDELITADNAEPKSIDELKKQHGIRRIIKAIKGKGSVESGEKWLDERAKIVIDPIRCPKTAEEYENIDYATDRDGNPKNRLEDKNNHSIDATRYAIEDEQGKGKIKITKPIRIRR